MRILSALILFLMLAVRPAAATDVYLLPVNDEIGSKTWRFVRSGLDEASRTGAEIVILRLNTYGGSVDAADSIRTAIMRFPRPVVAFVDNNAASAGALIALACDSVWMLPGSTMGAATVVNGVDGAAMPDKYQSYMRAMMRATAEHHGRDSLGRWRRDPLIAEAMVDSRVEVPGLIDSTRVLTFTSDEAIKWGYAEGHASGVPDLLRQLGVEQPKIATYTPDWTDYLIGFLTNPGFQAVLVALILMGIYWEIQSPGSGIPITASIVSAVLYFLPACLGGIISPWAVVLFAVGLVLLAFEIFVIPGFGVCGIGGIACIVVSLVWALAENISFDAVHEATPDAAPDMFGAIVEALMWFMGAVVVAVAVSAWLTSKRGPKAIRRHTELTHSQLIRDGYIGVDMDAARYVGSRAVTLTPLRPSGKIAVGTDGQEFDAVAVGGSFIDAGVTVEVMRYAEAQLYVRRVKSE